MSLTKIMTERLYYQDSFQYEFSANVVEVIRPPDAAPSRVAVVLDRTAFYPTSGGQVFDTGWITPVNSPEENTPRVVIDVRERKDGAILHFLDHDGPIQCGCQVRGLIDRDRRRDHMQQHSGQHVLSAAFVNLFNLPTVSFHMGDNYCCIDLDTDSLDNQQIEAAERLANEIILEDRAVEVRFVTQEEAHLIGLRKPAREDKPMLRLIDIHDFDLTACGGTHVRSTGQIGCILLRKAEKVRQGMRVEFVCGQRAVKTARQDYASLTEAAGLYSTHIWDLPQQIRKAQEEAKADRRLREKLIDELAQKQADRILAETERAKERKMVIRIFEDRDLAYVRLLAQKLTRAEPHVIALLGTLYGQASLIFAQSKGQPFDMSALMKEALSELGGRGGGSKEMAQGGPEEVTRLEPVLRRLGDRLR